MKHALGPQGRTIVASAGEAYRRPLPIEGTPTRLTVDRQKLRERIEAATIGGVDPDGPRSLRRLPGEHEERDLFDLSVSSPSPGGPLDARPAWDCVGAGASSLVPLLKRNRRRERG